MIREKCRAQSATAKNSERVSSNDHSSHAPVPDTLLGSYTQCFRHQGGGGGEGDCMKLSVTSFIPVRNDCVYDIKTAFMLAVAALTTDFLS